LSYIADNPRHVVARKLEHTVQVRFTSEPCTVQTTEGLVHAHPGDAIVTGIAGENWRVSKAHFADKYRPVQPTQAGADGPYKSRRLRILALQMSEPFEVLLADGVSRLKGRPGDWLVDYGDGSLGIVSETIFPTTYEIAH
jgi:hypothetical protein